MKKRHKPNIPLLTEAEVDEHLRQLGILKADLAIAVANKEKELAKVRKRFEGEEYAIGQQIDGIDNKITYYLTYHRDDFVAVRTCKLRHGSIGWRKVRSDKLNVKAHEIAVAALKKLGLRKLITTKETVNKDALTDHLKDYPDDLDKIDGVSKPEEKEECWFEVRREPEPITP